jgi:hypothetical protein
VVWYSSIKGEEQKAPEVRYINSSRGEEQQHKQQGRNIITKGEDQ